MKTKELVREIRKLYIEVEDLRSELYELKNKQMLFKCNMCGDIDKTQFRKTANVGYANLKLCSSCALKLRNDYLDKKFTKEDE